MTATISYFTTTNFITIPGETNSLFTRPAKTIAIDLPICTQTIQPDHNGHVPPGTCNALWTYYPSFTAAITFSLLFGAVTIAHIWQAARYRKKWCWVIIVAAAWETFAFVFRSISTKHQQNSSILLVFQIFVLTGPLWINAFAYIVLARMIYYFNPSRGVFRIPAEALAATFVGLDILSFVIQLVGGGMASPTSSVSQQLKGIHIYMGGIGMQQGFIVLFTVLAVKFHLQRLMLDKAGLDLKRQGWKPLLYAVYGILGLITVRIIFRFAEFSSGPNDPNVLTTHEAPFYILEAVPMLIALLLIGIVHPGAILHGPDAEMPGLWSRLRDCCMHRRRRNRVYSGGDECNELVAR